MTPKDIRPQAVRARELFGDFWFNAEPVLLSALRGQVVLIEFWDYTCTASLRTLPYVKEWHQRYSPYGLVVVGVHTPKFSFGRDPELVQRAVQHNGIGYPVVMDNEALIASRYDCRCWPCMYLVDKDGFIRYQSDGDGNYAGTEHAIQTLLYDAGVGQELPILMEPFRDVDRTGAVLYKPQQELFAGYLRGSIGNVEGYSPESVVSYADPEIYLDGRFYLVGAWGNERDCVRQAAGADPRGQVILPYQSMEVNAVFKPASGEMRVAVQQDARFLEAANKGDDVRIGPGGGSFVVIDEPRMYSIVRNKEYGEHVVRFSTSRSGLALYSFAFVTGVIPELISKN